MTQGLHGGPHQKTRPSNATPCMAPIHPSENHPVHDYFSKHALEINRIRARHAMLGQTSVWDLRRLATFGLELVIVVVQARVALPNSGKCTPNPALDCWYQEYQNHP